MKLPTDHNNCLNCRLKVHRAIWQWMTAWHLIVKSRLATLHRVQHIHNLPAACFSTSSRRCLLLPATAHFRELPPGLSAALRATSSTTNCPVNPVAPKITMWYGLLEVVSAIVCVVIQGPAWQRWSSLCPLIGWPTNVTVTGIDKWWPDLL